MQYKTIFMFIELHESPANITIEHTDIEEKNIDTETETETEETDETEDYIDADESFSDNSKEDDENEFNNMSIIDGLRYWALTNNSTHRSVNMMLKLFKKANIKVPASAKTLLRTKRNPSSEIKEIGYGQYWYRGIANALLNYFRYVCFAIFRIFNKI